MRSKQLGQLLLENGDVQADQIARALKIQEEQGGMIGVILRNEGAVTDQAVAQALLKQVQVTDVKCDELTVDPAVAQLIDKDICETEKLCPFERLGNLLCIVMGNPLNRRAITQIEERTHLKVKSFKSIWPKISDLIQNTYGGEGFAPAADDAPTGEPAGESAENPGLALVLEDDAAPARHFDQPQAPLEITQIETVFHEKQAPVAPKRKREPERPAGPQILGLDNLNEANAELIETNRRGLTKRSPGDIPVAGSQIIQSKTAKTAKINVDLDALDLSSGEVVKSSFDTDEAGEQLEEISEDAPVTKALQRHVGEIVPLKSIRDGYFYSDGRTPSQRSDELESLLDTLPVAEVVAESIGDYEEKQKPAAKPTPQEKPALKTASASSASASAVAKPDAARLLELQPAPVGALAAVAISETEFERHMVSLSMGEDPVGEWDWNYAASGPVQVQPYEEN
jgi:hypothetical protein